MVGMADAAEDMVDRAGMVGTTAGRADRAGIAVAVQVDLGRS